MKRLTALALLLLPATGCADRQIDGPDEVELLPVCMLYPARGYDEQGNSVALIIAPHGSTGRTCGCVTQEEWDQRLFLDEYNDRALEECLQLAAPYPANDCQQMHDEGEWLILVWLAIDNRAWWAVEEKLDCSGDADAGCTVTDERSSPWGLLPLLLLLGLRRRHQHRRAELQDAQAPFGI